MTSLLVTTLAVASLLLLAGTGLGLVKYALDHAGGEAA